MSATTPTPGQARVLAYFRAYHAAQMRPPTLREACKALDIASTNAISEHVKALAKKGHMVNLGGTRGWMVKR